ncbi:protein phosphatase 2C domain-containing protein, partial [Escherichia coli]|nr:protein phosphatase 2C domain-containing protein [Escherichia coli]
PELLKQFLSSPAVNERTDDDKTLALALWLP